MPRCLPINVYERIYLLFPKQHGKLHKTFMYLVHRKYDKKGQLSLTNPRDACETFARFIKSSGVVKLDAYR